MRNKEVHCIMLRTLIDQEDRTIIYVPNIRAPKNTKQILIKLKGGIVSSIIISGDFLILMSK